MSYYKQFYELFFPKKGVDMDLLKVLGLILEILKLFKDTDADGRPDLFDSEPKNPEVK